LAVNGIQKASRSLRAGAGVIRAFMTASLTVRVRAYDKEIQHIPQF